MDPYVQAALLNVARRGLSVSDVAAMVEMTYRPTLRIEEPSARGDPEWMGGVYVDAIIPLR